MVIDRFQLFVGALIAGMVCLCQAAEAPKLNAADYEAASRLISSNLRGLVYNESVHPHWIGLSGRFWYRRDSNKGPEFVIVSPDGVKSLAFDHGAIARALTETLGVDFGTGLPLGLADARLSDDLAHLSGRLGDTSSFNCDLRNIRCRIVEPALADPGLLPSPDRRKSVFARGNDLWIRDTATGGERRVASDGAPFFSWGKPPDDSLTVIARKKAGIKSPPFETYWSPDSRYLIASRADEREIAPFPFVEWVPTDGSRRPVVHEVRQALPGDREMLKLDYFLFDLSTGRQTRIALPVEFQPIEQGREGMVLGWSMQRKQAFLLAPSVGSRALALFRLDLSSGRLTKLIEEASPVRVTANALEFNLPNVRLVGDGDEIVWWSERTGWGHLYLYDAQAGQLKATITRGDWLVNDVHHIDERRREIYFTASGREKDRDPYYRFLYRASLDGRQPIQLLTEPNADHHFDAAPSSHWARLRGNPSEYSMISPNADVFVDTWSTVEEPPISVLRSTRDGRMIAELERADASRLYATGWTKPVREPVKAADGVTDLYAVYWAPTRRAAGKRHPVVDAAYGGPVLIVAPRNFVQAYRMGASLGNPASLARLGFCVVTVDGRGMPGRSRAFRDNGYPEFTQVGIDDHIAAIHELARRHAEMDINRVGIFGVSWGGAFSAQAILSRPEFYKVSVSISGGYDYAATYITAEPYIGPAIYADGTRYRSKPDEVPVGWEKVDVTRLANRLSGRLLIVYGDMDENVSPVHAFRLIDALTRANKPYDLIALPNGTHAISGDPYVIKRTWDYYVEHLLGEVPPFDTAIRVRTQ